jgi:hypothetical protein
MKEQSSFSINCIVLLLTSLMLVACASPADPSRMVPTDAVVNKTHNGTVNIAVTGGRDTNPMWTSQVSNEDFRQALETSLLRYGVFSRVIQNTSANYRLDVTLRRLKQPFAGFNMTVAAEVSWTLADAQSGRVLWHEVTTSRYTATVGNAFYGVHRLELPMKGQYVRASKQASSRFPNSLSRPNLIFS